MECIKKDKGEVWEADRDCTITVKECTVFLSPKIGREPLVGFSHNEEVNVKQGDKIRSIGPFTIARPVA